MWLIAQLPYPWQLRMGRFFGRVMRIASPRRRHIAAVNLALCFPELSARQRTQLLHRHFESLGMTLVETSMSWWLPADKLRRLARIEGLQHLQQALQRGKGAILLSAHFTTLEIGAHLLAIQVPFHAMYRAHKNLLFDALMRRAREARCDNAIPRHDVRGLLRSLKAGLPVWYAPDQNYGKEHSIFVPFFGVPAATITATARLAQLSGAPVVPFFQERLAHGAGYLLKLYPALHDFPSHDLVHDTRRINEIIEQQIRRVPEQYLWVHRRFKTRPPGSANVYGRGSRNA